MPVRDWDGATYDRISRTMEKLGLEVLDRLQLRGDEAVLDAGCGSGRITQTLIERLPRGRVIAIDESPSMIAAARERLGPDPDLRVGDLLELELEEPVDAILSTATFHWIKDHERLFARLHAALRPGGRLLAQCGGEGNIDVLRGRAREVIAREPYAEHFRDWQPPWNYAGPEITRERLLARRLHERRVLAAAGAARAGGPARVPVDDRARAARAAAARGAARAVHGRGAGSARRAGDRRLRAPEHRRRRLSAGEPAREAQTIALPGRGSATSAPLSSAA